MRSAPGFQLVTMPSRLLLMMASSEELMIAARNASADGNCKGVSGMIKVAGKSPAAGTVGGPSMKTHARTWSLCRKTLYGAAGKTFDSRPCPARSAGSGAKYECGSPLSNRANCGHEEESSKFQAPAPEKLQGLNFNVIVLSGAVLALRACSNFDLPDSPGRVFRNKRLGIVSGLFKSGQAGSVSHITERDAHVTQESPPFGSEHGCSSKLSFESGFIERQQFQELG